MASVADESEDQKVTRNKLALKLVTRGDCKEEEILELLSKYINPSVIEALVYDYYNLFFTLFLNHLEALCALVGKTLHLRDSEIEILPLLDYFVIDNVYPSISNEDIKATFKVFGKVFSVYNCRVLPNSSKFGHVLSGRREICFFLSTAKKEIDVPQNVFHGPYLFHVKRFCIACLTVGHSMIQCPDNDNNLVITPKQEIESESEIDVAVQEAADGLCEAWTDDEECDSSGAPEESSVSQSSARGSSSGSVSSSSSIDTTVVSTQLVDTPVPMKKGKKHFSRVVEDMISASKGVLMPYLLRRLLLIDYRNDSKVMDFALNCTQDVDGLHKQILKLQSRCKEASLKLKSKDKVVLMRMRRLAKLLKSYLRT